MAHHYGPFFQQLCHNAAAHRGRSICGTVGQENPHARFRDRHGFQAIAPPPPPLPMQMENVTKEVHESRGEVELDGHGLRPGHIAHAAAAPSLRGATARLWTRGALPAGRPPTGQAPPTMTSRWRRPFLLGAEVERSLELETLAAENWSNGWNCAMDAGLRGLFRGACLRRAASRNV